MAGPAHVIRKAARTVSVQTIELRQYIGDATRTPGFGHKEIPWKREIVDRRGEEDAEGV